MSKISVVVPIYNSEKYLRKCISSILNQEFKDFELILVNDGSKDKSLQVCRRYEKNDNRIIVVDKKNEGSIIARRTGIELAKSDYITFVDSDDWIHKETLKVVNEEIEKNKSDIIIFNMYKVIDSLGIIKKESNRRYFKMKKIFIGEEVKDELASAYLHGHPFPASLCGKVYKKEYLLSCGRYLKNIRFLGDDLYYNLEIFLKVTKVSLIDRSFYYYKAGGNTSKYMPYLFNDMVEGYNIQKEVIEEYYQETKQKRYNGISIMLLNTFKTTLSNLFLSNLNQKEKEDKILNFINDKRLIESTQNEGANRYFNKEYLEAIKNKDSSYLYNLGKEIHNKSIYKKCIVKLVSYL